MRKKFSIGSALVLSGMLLFAGYGWAQTKSGSDAGMSSSDTTKSKAPAKSAASGGGSENVRKVQQALKDKGQDPGPIDGRMGPKTKAAIKAYQSANNMKATGSMDSATMKSLGVESASSSSGSSASKSTKSSSSDMGADKSGSEKSSSSNTGADKSGSAKSSASKTGSDAGSSSSFSDQSSGRNAPSSRDKSAK